MMTIAVSWGLRADDTNPCRKIKRYAEFARERSISPAELRRLGAVLQDQATNPEGGEDWRAITCYRLLLLTGARLGAMLTLRWKYIDWTRSVARLPDSKTGPKNLLLSRPALDILASLPSRAERGYVLPGEHRDSHFVGIQKP